jgi:hypothetical protein
MPEDMVSAEFEPAANKTDQAVENPAGQGSRKVRWSFTDQ